MDFGSHNKRKYQCFICSRSFSHYQEFKKHILDNHEEGREYVKCPLNRCQAPVRDIKSHFNAKHPKEKIPKNCQLSALIWKDFSGRKKRTKKPKFRDGYLISVKNDGKPMHYRSGYEKVVYEKLEKLDEVVSYDVEPFSVPYYFNGKKHNYFPDVSILFDNGDIEIWEIKPSNQTHIEKNQAKWEACHHYCLNKGWQFKVKTEKGIEELN